MDDDAGPQVFGQLLILFILILVNAFAASEMAMISVDKNKISARADDGDKKAKMLLDLLREPSRFLSTIQVGITLAGFFTSASAAVGISNDLARILSRLGIPFAKDIAFVSITLMLGYFTLVLGELVPKRIALQNAEKFSMFSIRIINLIAKS